MPASARKRPSAYPTSTISARLSASSVSSDLEPWWILMRVYEDDFIMRVFMGISLRSAFHKKLCETSEKFHILNTKSASIPLLIKLYLFTRRRWWRQRCTNNKDDHKERSFFLKRPLRRRRRRWRWRWTNNNKDDDDHKKRRMCRLLCRRLQCLHLCRAVRSSVVVVPGGSRPSP